MRHHHVCQAGQAGSADVGPWGPVGQQRQFDEVGSSRSDVQHRNFCSLPCMCVANGSTDIRPARGDLQCRSIERNCFRRGLGVEGDGYGSGYGGGEGRGERSHSHLNNARDGGSRLGGIEAR